MTTELVYLALTALITVLMWIPGTLQLIQGQGLMAAFGNRDNLQPLAPWAERSQRAHRNAVDNLVVFAPLVLAADVAGVTSGVTAWAAGLYFWMRLLHYLSYTFGIIYLRSAVWTVAWICQLVLAWQVLV